MYETGGTRRRSAINGSWLILLDILNSFVGKREYEDEFNEVERCVRTITTRDRSNSSLLSRFLARLFSKEVKLKGCLQGRRHQDKSFSG